MTVFEIDAATWATLNRLLDEALELPPAARDQWINGLSAEMSPLKPRLRSLLARGLTEEGSALQTLPKLLGGTAEDAEPASCGTELDVPDHAAPMEAVQLLPGARLGRFEIRGLLGLGGMGRVYRAYEPELGREVAIKALTHALQGDPSSLQRAEREARLLATLNHPNIAAIHGFERIDGAPYLILELVEGETLAERLQRGPLTGANAVAVALQIASALQEAHRQGVVHRDLKPSNVKLGPDGRVRVLDFGIAKVAVRSADSAPQAVSITAEGLVRGTAPYMSPEQIRGEPPDTRGDVWAFGCVLYEMLTGRLPFRGTSTAEVMAAVLRDPVDWGRLPRETPAALRRLLRRCLAREKNDRLQDMGDARIELHELERGEGEEAGTGNAARPPPAILRWLPAAVAVGALVLSALLVQRSRERVPPRVARLGLELPPGLALAEDYAAPFAIAPDGSRLVLFAKTDGPSRLHLRNLGSTEARPLPGTEGAWQAFFSPDGREVAFFADRKLKKVSLEGGSVTTLAEIGDNPRGGAWSADGSIVVAPSNNRGLSRVSTNGGALTDLTRLDLPSGESSHRWPQVLPGGRWVLFTVGFDASSFDDAAVDAVSLSTGERRRLVEGGSFGRYAAGLLVFGQAGRLLGVPLELDPLAVRGAPETVLDSIRYDPRNGSAHLAFSDTGTLVYGTGVPTSLEHHLSWVDGGGELTRWVGAPRRFRDPRLSPDGRRLAVVVGPAAGSDLWVVDPESATYSRVSFGLSPRRPVWTPDGQGITVGAKVGELFKLLTLPASGGGEPTVVLEGTNRVYPSDWSADGRFLVFQERRPETGWDIRLLEPSVTGGPAALRDLAARPSQEVNAAVSLDSRLVAYESDELDGVVDTYVLPIADPSAYVRATRGGTNWPRWGASGALYYWSAPRAHPGDRGLAAGLHRAEWQLAGRRLSPVRASAVWPPEVRGPALFDRLLVAGFAGYDVDDRRAPPRFLTLETASTGRAPAPSRPMVVLNWFEELRRRRANADPKAP